MMMSLLRRSPPTSANDPVPWIRFRPFPPDLPALHLHAGVSHHLHIVLETCHHPHGDRDGLGAPPSTLLVTEVEDDL